MRHEKVKRGHEGHVERREEETMRKRKSPSQGQLDQYEGEPKEKGGKRYPPGNV